MSIEELAGVVGVVAIFLQPDRQVFVVQTLADKFRIPSYIPRALVSFLELLKAEDLTMWRINICNVGVVSCFASPKTDA